MPFSSFVSTSSRFHILNQFQYSKFIVLLYLSLRYTVDKKDTRIYCFIECSGVLAVYHDDIHKSFVIYSYFYVVFVFY